MLQRSNSYYVGDWWVEPTLLRVSRNDNVKKLEPQMMAVLEYLVAKSGQVVSKGSLMEAIWGDVIVSENVLTRVISSLRKVLGDDPVKPAYIETISKTGYRLIATVKPRKTTTANFAFAQKWPLLLLSLFPLAVLGIFSAKTSPSDAEQKMYHPNALAYATNTEYWPAISPDGKFVAYGWKGMQNDNWDIYVKQIDTETSLRLTDHPATELRAKWSSDGNYIYFVRYENGGSTIYKQTLLGGEEIRVLRSPAYSTGDFDISPDEKWICYNDREDRSSPLRIKLISLETGTEKWLTKPSLGYKGDIHPTFSDDGKTLAFIREKNPASMQLWMHKLELNESEQITSEHLSINGFDWSDNGNTLYYGSDKTGLYKLWTVDLKTKETAILPVGDYQMVMPRIAKTGRTVYAKMKDNVNLWTYDLALQSVQPWRVSNELDLNPVIAPNGEQVCFTAKKDGEFQVWVAKIDGTQAVPLTDFSGGYPSAIRWSADSKTLVFQAYLNGQADIFKVNALGGIPKNLTASSTDDHTPFMVGNDKIYFSSNRSGAWSIWTMDIEGQSVKKIVGKHAYGPQLNQKANKMYYTKKNVLGLWTFDLEEARESLLISDFHPMYWGAFSIAETGIYYLHAISKRFEYFDLHTRESSFVYQPQARIPRLGVTLHFSPRLGQLIFSQIDQNDADIMLMKEL